MPAPAARSAFLTSLFRALDADWEEERELTARVATLAALDLSFAQITEQLGIDPIKVRGAVLRLRRVAPQLLREGMQ
jgi:hypothetical protein